MLSIDIFPWHYRRIRTHSDSFYYRGSGGWAERRTTGSLCREREQYKDVNPQSRHAMPIPGGDINDDASSFHRTMQGSRDVGTHKGTDAASEMKPVHRGKNIDKRNAG